MNYPTTLLAVVKCPLHYRKHTMATPNYGFDKRQKELAKKKKKEEKLKNKAERKSSEASESEANDDGDIEPTGDSNTPE
jgi:hypothetical protein